MRGIGTVLDGLDVAVAPFAVCELHGQGRLDLGRRTRATLHYALAGEGRLIVGERYAIDLAPATIVVVPATARQRLERGGDSGSGSLCALPSTCEPLGDGWDRIRCGAGAGHVTMVCGSIDASFRHTLDLFDFLAEPIVERPAADDPALAALRSLLSELAAPGPGTRALAGALMRQCLILLLRRRFGDGDAWLPWLAALEDARLSDAVRAMIDDPAAAHSVESLADLVGASRSTFADRFARAFGCGPMAFLRRTRLHRAGWLLRSTDEPVKHLARRVGYDSRSYFTRAFREQFGVSPAAYRNDLGGLRR